MSFIHLFGFKFTIWIVTIIVQVQYTYWLNRFHRFHSLALCVRLGFGWLFHNCIYIGETMQQFWCSVHCAKNSLPNRNWKQLLLIADWCTDYNKQKQKSGENRTRYWNIKNIWEKNSERKNTTNNESFEVNFPNAQDR